MTQSGVRPTVPREGSHGGALLRRVAVAENRHKGPDGAASGGPQDGDSAARVALSLAPEPASSAAPAPAPATPALMPANPERPAAPGPVADRSTWERLAITPDVELHVRRPLDRTANKRVDQLERIARELFEDV